MHQGMEEVFRQQQQAHLADPYPSYRQRRDRIRRMVAMLLDHRQQFNEALNHDFCGRSADMNLAVEFMPTVTLAKYVLKHLRQWMKAERRKSTFPFNITGGKSSIHYLPLGVVGNISPWNFPVNLTFGPVSSIFAAGNRCMIKPSELSEATSAVMAERVPEYFNPAELAVVTGGADTAAQFSSLPFDHLLFTGSTAVGRKVMMSAANNLVPVTLELGGKSPVVISTTADIKTAARRIIFGKTMNAGQICIAPDYVLIPESLQPTLIAEMRAALAGMYPNIADNPDYTHIINRRHFQWLSDLLSDAEAKGAVVHPLSEASANPESRFFPPYALTGAPHPARVHDEEIFGPLLPIVSYSSFDEVGRYIYQGERPLALYYFGSSQREIAQLRDKVISGGMVVNDVLMHYLQEDLPFGGVGASGMGRYHGIEGFKTFSHARSVYRQSPLDISRMIHPPFARQRRLMEKQLTHIRR